MTTFINGFFTSLQSLFTWALDGMMLVLKSAFYFPFDGILSCIEAFVGSLDLSGLVLSGVASWGLMPSQLIYCICATGLLQCFSILVYAVGLRMILNLIPAAFTRI